MMFFKTYFLGAKIPGRCRAFPRIVNYEHFQDKSSCGSHQPGRHLIVGCWMVVHGSVEFTMLPAKIARAAGG